MNSKLQVNLRTLLCLFSGIQFIANFSINNFCGFMTNKHLQHLSLLVWNSDMPSKAAGRAVLPESKHRDTYFFPHKNNFSRHITFQEAFLPSFFLPKHFQCLLLFSPSSPSTPFLVTICFCLNILYILYLLQLSSEHARTVQIPILGVPYISANIHCKSRNFPNTDIQNYSTDLR